MSWTWDAPTGTYRNHALSSDIRKVAIADAKFMQFARPEPGFGKNKGDTVTITKILALPLAGKVNEIERLPSGRPAISTKSVTVSEWGFKLQMTELEKNLTFFDLTNPLQQALRDQMSLTMDKMCADAAKTTPYKYIPLIAGGVFDTDGTASSTADRNLNVNDLRLIHDELAGVLKAPTYRNGRYMGILTTKAARGIKNDPEYKDWQAPTTSAPLMDGALRDVENFNMIETNHYNALSNGVGSGSVLGEAIFFAADGYGLVVVANPELRAAPDTDDLGRFWQIGWVGTLDAFLVWETASQARVIHVTSA